MKPLGVSKIEDDLNPAHKASPSNSRSDVNEPKPRRCDKPREPALPDNHSTGYDTMMDSQPYTRHRNSSDGLVMCPIASCGAIYERNEQARHMKESINEHIFCLNKTLSQHQEIIYMQNKIIVEQREKIERLESHVNLITHNKEWKGLVDKLVKAAEEDGPEALVTLMKTHKHNTGVISRCCESMTNVCKTDPKSRTNFRDVGACEVVVQAMNDYPSKRDIQKQGCSAIWTLALEPSNRSYLGEAGANLAVIEALKAFPQDKPLIISGVVAIGYLAMDNENRELLTNAEACETLTTCLKNFKDDKIVQQIGCVSTGYLAAANAENAKRLGQAGICSLILHALKASPTEREIQKGGCHAILSLCSDRDNRKILASLYAYEAIARALTNFPWDLELQNYGCDSIRMLIKGCRTTVKEYQIPESGACKCLLSCIINFPKEKSLQLICYSAIRSLCAFEVCRIVFESAGACPAMVRALNNFPGDAEILEEGWKAIEAVSLGAVTSPHKKQNGSAASVA